MSVLYAPGGLTDDHRRLYADLKGKVLESVEGVQEHNVSSSEYLGMVGTLAHSRTLGIGCDEETGSWLACLGNPTAPSINPLAPAEVAPALLAAYLERGREAIHELNAPFAMVIFDGRDPALHVVTDRAGLQRIFLCRMDGAWLICSSSLALASSVPVRLDPAGVEAFFRTGGLLGELTLYDGIERAGAAKWLTLSGHGIEEKEYWRPPARESGGDLLQWAHELLDAGVEAAEAALQPGVPTTVEVTGGLDSRFNLACALATGRPFCGITIGDVVQEDVDVAARLSQEALFEHHVVSPLEELAETFEADFEEIHRLCDGELDCLNVIASPAANRLAARLRMQSVTGIAGELFRGSYYRSLGLFSRDVSLHRLIDWQLCLNSGYRSDIFSPALSNGSADIFRSSIQEILKESHGRSGTWRAEHFQLRGPVQGKAGRSMTYNGFYYRQAVFHCSNRMLDLAFRMPPAVKKGSRAVRCAISLGAPVIADVPLASGFPLRPLSAGNAAQYARGWLRYGRRVRGKLRDKYLRLSAHPAGAGTGALRRLVHDGLAGISKEYLDVEKMASAALYDPDRLRGFIRQNVDAGFPCITQIGLILSMEKTLRYVRGNLKTD